MDTKRYERRLHDRHNPALKQADGKAGTQAEVPTYTHTHHLIAARHHTSDFCQHNNVNTVSHVLLCRLY